MIEQNAPVLTILFPFFAALICGALTLRRITLLPIAFMGSVGSLLACLLTLGIVEPGVPVQYTLGGWPRPFGIELVVDYFNGIVMVMVAAVSSVNMLFSYRAISELPHQKQGLFYTLALLLQAGLMGMVATGDVFNIYVFLEITALTSYALIALGGGRALIATLNYLLFGSIGACFFLLGIGYIYIKTGSLNMYNLSEILPGHAHSQAVMIGMVLTILGMWIKMALFPLHSWLPNAYTYAPDYVSSLIAPLATKVSIYVMIRLIFTVFSEELIFSPIFNTAVVSVASVGIIIASISALAQSNLKKILTYIIIAEVGYMVGGAWLANTSGLVGAAYHIVSDGLMTLCLFLAVSAIIYRRGCYELSSMEGVFRDMPFTMIAFVIGALSMIGVPPTCGFFSKWYLLQGGMESGNYLYVVALLFSSLVNAVIFFKFFEIGFFGANPESHGDDADHDHLDDDHGEHASLWETEAPLSMLIPLYAVAISLPFVGLISDTIIRLFKEAGLQV